MLKEVYENLAQERFVPDREVLDIDSPKPGDIAMAFKYNYQLILQATTKKALRILKKDIKTESRAAQTMVSCVSAEEYEELSKKYDKMMIAVQSAQLQIDKLREANNSKHHLAGKT